MQRFFANIPEKIGCGNPMIHSDKLGLRSYLTLGQKKGRFPAVKRETCPIVMVQYLTVKPGPDEVDKFGPGFIYQKCSGKVGSRGYGILFLYAPHAHAHMLSFNNYGNAKGFQGVLNGFLYLGSKPFLNLKPAGISINNPWNLAQPNDVSVGDVGYMCPAEKRDHVMLTH